MRARVNRYERDKILFLNILKSVIFGRCYRYTRYDYCFYYYYDYYVRNAAVQLINSTNRRNRQIINTWLHIIHTRAGIYVHMYIRTNTFTS